MVTSDAAVEMPRYQCHKIVSALKIGVIDSDFATLYPEDKRFLPFGVGSAFFRRHQPVLPGYYVVYEDGYKSWSPAKAFESGYTQI